MKNVTKILIILSFMAAVVLLFSSRTRASETETFSQTVETRPGASLVVEKFSGDINIKGTNDNQLSVTVELEVKTGSDNLIKEFIDNSSLEVTSSPDGYRVKFETPMLSDDSSVPEALMRNFKTLFRSGTWQISSSQKMQILLPREHNVTVQNSYGDVSMDKVFGNHELRNSSGEILITNSGGQLFAKNSYARVDISDFAGSIEVHSSSGEIKAFRIGGDAVLANSYRNVTFAEIDGDCMINSSSAQVTGEQVTGRCEIKTSYKKVDVAQIKGDLIVHASSADVTAGFIGGAVEIESSYNPVVVDSVGGRLTIKSSSAAVTASRIGGRATVHSSYDPIHIKDVNGAVDVDGSSCSVKVESIYGDVSISASYNDILAKDITGHLTIHGSSAPITAENVSGSAVIRSTYNAIAITKVVGNLQVDGSSCSITAKEIGGDIDVSNTYKYVVLSGTRGSVTVHGSSSPIEVDVEDLPATKNIELATTYKQVLLKLPRATNASLDVTADKIEIENIRNIQPGDFKAEEIEFNHSQSRIMAEGRLNLKLGESESSIVIKTGGKVMVTQK